MKSNVLAEYENFSWAKIQFLNQMMRVYKRNQYEILVNIESRHEFNDIGIYKFSLHISMFIPPVDSPKNNYFIIEIGNSHLSKKDFKSKKKIKKYLVNSELPQTYDDFYVMLRVADLFLQEKKDEKVIA